jgi:outer membrane protein assembly factor BamB
MKKTDFLKIAILLLVSAILTLSCKKDHGSLPDYRESTPFYDDIPLLKIWSDTVPSIHRSYIHAKTLGVDQGILYLALTNREIVALDIVNQKKLWHNSLDSFLFEYIWDVGDEFKDEERILLFSTRGIAVLDAVSGGIKIQKKFNEIIPTGTSVFACNILHGKYYFLSGKYAFNPSLVYLWSFDPATENLSLVWSSDYEMLLNSSPGLFVDSVNNKLLFFYYTPSSGSQAYSIGSYDVKNDLFRSIAVGHDHSISNTNYRKYYVKNNQLIGNYSSTSAIDAINLSSGQVDWKAKGYYFKFFGDKLITNLGNELYLYNSNTGQLIWNTKNQFDSGMRQTAFHPTKPYLMHFDNVFFQMRDLKDGQLLAKWSLSDFSIKGLYSNELTCDPTSGQMIMLITDENYNLSLHTFQFPL